ncbi:MAG TPA: DUF465 domain-containing protein [Alphaproteobacteria bacterium]|nr:DUF465 domain-containing protein [Alphaproteobacteria bacterium]
MAYNGNHPLTEQMKHNPHVQSLLHKHEIIETELRAEMAHPAVDATRVKELKLKKLHLTEEIMRQRH